ncbi:uncharacterized protein LOC143747387 [Siphateles boraxobius]|uniref:uncharacterized protein LOC143747387 n=1 Tax=Siphateles boraxobius TaxID=180520 RepID=UPI0040636168
MGECMLDLCGEGFDEWSTFSSADWTEPQRDDLKNTFSDLGGLQDKTRKEELSTMHVTETGTFQFPENADKGDEVNPWFVFNDCFQVEEAEKNHVMMEIPTLTQLQQSALDTPSHSAAISRQAAHFWCHLQSGSKFLRLSGPKPKLHSREALLDSLQLSPPDASADSQTTTLTDLDLDNPEEAPGALIQTKLMPSSQNSPGFFYQISSKWLSQYSINLRPNQQ